MESSPDLVKWRGLEESDLTYGAGILAEKSDLSILLKESLSLFAASIRALGARSLECSLISSTGLTVFEFLFDFVLLHLFLFFLFFLIFGSIFCFSTLIK